MGSMDGFWSQVQRSTHIHPHIQPYKHTHPLTNKHSLSHDKMFIDMNTNPNIYPLSTYTYPLDFFYMILSYMILDTSSVW